MADIYHGLVDLFHAVFRVGVGVLIIVVADFRVGKLHLVHQLFKIARGAQIVACKRHIVLDRRLGSERRLQICKSAFHAIIVCRRIKALCNRIKLRLIFLAQLKPRRVRLQIQRRDRMEHVCRAGQKRLLPGLGVAVRLLVESLRRVHQIAQIRAVVVGERVILLPVVKIEHPVVQFLTAAAGNDARQHLVGELVLSCGIGDKFLRLAFRRRFLFGLLRHAGLRRVSRRCLVLFPGNENCRDNRDDRQRAHNPDPDGRLFLRGRSRCGRFCRRLLRAVLLRIGFFFAGILVRFRTLFGFRLCLLIFAGLRFFRHALPARGAGRFFLRHLRAAMDTFFHSYSSSCRLRGISDNRKFPGKSDRSRRK